MGELLVKKDEGGFVQGSAPYVKTGETTWSKGTAVFEKTDVAVWTKRWSPEVVISITGTHTNFNLYSHIGLPDSPTITVRLESGSVFNSNNPDVPAFNVGNTFSGKQLIIENYGSILGRGGRAGQGGIPNGDNSVKGDGTAGGRGGTAFYCRTERPVILRNFYRIGSGGGGGGGGGGMYTAVRRKHTSGQSQTALYEIRGDNGAEGSNGFINAVNSPVASPVVDPGSKLSGATGQLNPGRGGKGGSTSIAAAQAGTVSSNNLINPGSGWSWEVSPNFRAGSAGGAGPEGYAIDGVSKVSLTNSGEIRGPQVN